MKRPSSLFVAPFILVFLACSSGGTSAGAADSGASPESEDRRSPNLITRAELAEAGELNALEAVQRLRSRWLRIRGQTTFGVGGTEQGIKVYVNGARRGGLDELESFRATEVEQMRFLSGREATARYGTDHAEGAILVTLRTS